MTDYAVPIREEAVGDAVDLASELSQLDQPVVLRGLATEWPLVRIGDADGIAALEHIAVHDSGQPVTVFRAPPSVAGRIFYSDDLDSLNFTQSREAFGAIVADLREHLNTTEQPVIYMGSSAMDHFFPGLSEQNSFTMDVPNLTKRIWLGTASVVAPHYDAMENLACVVAGQRRFTLFPPDQIDNLYVGPIDFTPAGQTVSLVDARAPDLERFPRFEVAMSTAVSADLDPGDAIYIPPLWWHQVEALSPVNILINHWWHRAPSYAGAPQDALLHAIMNIRDLPPGQRSAWREVFDHYVFEATKETAAHIPSTRQGVDGSLNEQAAKQLRAMLRNNLNR